MYKLKKQEKNKHDDLVIIYLEKICSNYDFHFVHEGLALNIALHQ
jgi:hypothetical protein